MNQRERFLATARFETPDRAFLLQPWLWAATLERWRNEGLPPDADLADRFGTDREACAPLAMQGPYGPHLLPPLERRVLSETETHVVVRDEEGNTVRLFKHDPTQSMPEWIEYPMQGRDDWREVIRPRLDAQTPGRCPQGQELDQYAESVRDRDYALGLWCGSFYGWPRSLLGVERISTMFYDDPALIHEMCEHIAEFVVELIAPLLQRVDFDFAFIWEDMAGKAGPLCSPKTYREFMLPPLKRVTDLLRRHGVEIIIVDSDGNNDVLIPLWLEAGVTGLRPFEIAAGCDPVAIRKEYGRDLIIQGGIDKRALADSMGGARSAPTPTRSRGPEAIDREVLSKVPWLCLQGGFFPQVDHLVPPDVPLGNYEYYSQLLRQVVEEPERWLHEARARGLWTEG